YSNGWKYGPNPGFVTISEPVTNYIPSTTGVNEIETIMDIVVFPNPASDVINFVLKSNDFTSILKGEIYSQSGELIYSNDVNTNRYYALSTSSLSSGIYFLKITSKNRSFTTKFMVTK
ncbi:MAG: T9SS type A sorting domain-containing protein, partial [Saprospiraceae bacterium]|nr:T9SS type A sorting domain-containing protein [Candidatus Opimibacter skivensis]